ncbi:SMCs flexible hinge [Melanogaster broomeanus]|nr:SMCs flexible hinge [Melanogaster broomeanus]
MLKGDGVLVRLQGVSSSRQRTEDAKASQAASTSQNKVLAHLTRLKQYLFQGHLGSLGTIPNRYDVAISTACDALHNMVVDTVSQSQACINFLCSQSVGRASFMVLKELSTNRFRERIQTPEQSALLGSEAAGKNLEEALEALRAFKGEVEQLTLAGPQMEVDNKKLTMDVNNGRKRLTEAGAEISRRSRQNRELPKTLAKTSRKILDIGRFRLLRQWSTIEGIKLHINLANDEITKAEMAKAKAGKDVIKHDSAIAMNVTNTERSTKS